jgi:protein-disulfide isomerase
MLEVRQTMAAAAAIAWALVASLGAGQPSPPPPNERGPADARVTVVEYCTYDSDACSRLAVMLSVVLHEFDGQVRLIFHHVQADGTPAASLRYRAALVAGGQDAFWPMHEMLLANRDRGSLGDLVAMAGQLGLDTAQFRARLASDEILAAANRDAQSAAAQGVTTTPFVVVNGRALASVKEVKDLRDAIAQASKR